MKNLSGAPALPGASALPPAFPDHTASSDAGTTAPSATARAATTPSATTPLATPRPSDQSSTDQRQETCSGGAPGWRLAEITGRLTEVQASADGAALTLMMQMVLQAQQQQEPVAWITHRAGLFFPPDADSSGIDLQALPIIRIRDPRAAARAAELLLRSGAFGLVVLDLGRKAQLAPSIPARLLGLARHHDAAVVFLTDKDDSSPSLAPIISLRIKTRRTREGPFRFRCSIEALKDKRRGPGWRWDMRCTAPPGLS